MTSAFEMTNMILASCQTYSVQSIAKFHNHNCFAVLPRRKPDLHMVFICAHLCGP